MKSDYFGISIPKLSLTSTLLRMKDYIAFLPEASMSIEQSRRRKAAEW
jgi:hypothetical protein